MYLDYCLAPSNKYVGWIFYQNAYYFGSGDNIDQMAKAVKDTAYFHKRISRRDIVIAPKPTPRDSAPVDKMSKQFKTRAWFGRKTTDVLTAEQRKIHYRNMEEDKPTPEPEYDFYKTKIVNGKMVVYGCVKVAEYQLEQRDFSLEKKVAPLGMQGILNDPIVTDVAINND